MPSLLDARRTAAALVAVALSAALIAFAFIVSDSFTTQLTADARASVGDADVVVLPQRGEDLPESTAQNIAAANARLKTSMTKGVPTALAAARLRREEEKATTNVVTVTVTAGGDR